MKPAFKKVAKSTSPDISVPVALPYGNGYEVLSINANRIESVAGVDGYLHCEVLMFSGKEHHLHISRRSLQKLKDLAQDTQTSVDFRDVEGIELYDEAQKFFEAKKREEEEKAAQAETPSPAINAAQIRARKI